MTKISDLKSMADKLRIHSLKSTTEAGSGHPTSCLSCAEIMSCLFFSELGPKDEFVLSKGHAAPILWAAYAEAGCIPRKDLMDLRKIDSYLEGHPTARMPLIKVATGSLGQGLSAGVGMALAARLRDEGGRVYVLLGDGECAEGAVWEAASVADHYRLGNICAVIDVNRLGQSGPTMYGHDVDSYKKRFEAFGWDAVVIDGHNVEEILKAFEQARKSQKPFMVVAKTLKGKGVSFLEDKEGWHGKPLNRDDLQKALEEIGEQDIELASTAGCPAEHESDFTPCEINKYDIGDKVATRVASGNALVRLGEKNANIVVLDGDVKNSTMTQDFFKAFPERSFDSFIAEQNMVGMAAGFSAQGYVPFAATFSTFLTRAHDFIRMAQYSRSNIKLIGSHSGVSIGQDGPSQMGLEDIPMFLSMPDAVVLYPCDAVSTEYLVSEMAKHQGIFYLRTTRGASPVIYRNDEQFPIGGLKVVKSSDNDKVLVVAAGVTVYEALSAYDVLKEDGIHIRIIDLYSLQPVDTASLVKNARECGDNVIAVEDHYCGGLGSVVSTALDGVRQLCVREMPRSGKPKELRSLYGIDAAAIAEAVRQITSG
jgi:transketolase